MIEVCSLNGKVYFLNPDLIYRVEELPDTMITLVDGKTLYVLNSAVEIADLVLTYRQKVEHPNKSKE
ncbi:flagellar FlbD family protein [Enterococcus italicus]|uniref:flagellar FlbD family protein n=1 Tax=Enterococcus italicus TaxID=246144 RepID=UPI0028AA41FE|nr:flagellar FlbD family protein [Enterococcus italicus]